MRSSMKQASFAVALLAVASCSRERATAAPTESWIGDLPAFPGATASGTQHISGADMHIRCTLYVTSTRPEEVVAFYRARFPDAKVASARELEVRRPNDVVLAVHPADANVPHCNGTVGPNDRTIILVSQAIR